MNPSFVEKQKLKIVKDGKPISVSIGHYFRWDAKKSEGFLFLEESRLPGLALPLRGFYRPMREIADSHGVPMVHIDMFAVRETNQRSALDILGIQQHKEGDFAFSKFAIAQLDVFFRILEGVSPRVLVVANAQGSRILPALEKWGFIETKKVGSAKFRYILLIHPHLVIMSLQEKGAVPEEWKAAFENRLIEIGTVLPKGERAAKDSSLGA